MKTTLRRLFWLFPLALFLLPSDGLPQTTGQLCTTVQRMNLDTTASPDYVMDLDGAAAERTVVFSSGNVGYDVLSIMFALTDANTSITRLDTTCVLGLTSAAYPGSSTVKTGTPQVCDDTSDGVCTMAAAGTWQKASPGSNNLPYSLRTSGYGYVSCTWAVGTGSAGSSDDAEISYRWCSK